MSSVEYAGGRPPFTEKSQPTSGPKPDSPPPQQPSWACLQAREYTLPRPILPTPPYPAEPISEEKTLYPTTISTPGARPYPLNKNPLTEGLLEFRQPMTETVHSISMPRVLPCYAKPTHEANFTSHDETTVSS